MAGQEIAERTPQQELVARIRSEQSLEQFGFALQGTGISPAKFSRVAITALNQNSDLERAEPNSVFGSLMRCAQDGLLPDGREAALVMFGQKATYMPMVGGLRKIAAEYGWAIIASVVHENDSFDPDPEYVEHLPDGSPRIAPRANFKSVRLGMDPGSPVGAYAVGQHRDGRRILEVMNLQEIEAVRATSRAAKRGPWVDWWGEMARKTVVRRLFKSLPLDPKDRERIDRVLSATDVDTGEAVELLYGEDASGGRTLDAEAPVDRGEPHVETGDADPVSPASDVIEAEASEVFDGEDTPVVFEFGAHKGKTLDEVLALGDDGIAYLRVAFKQAKTEPLRSALDAFGEEHPEIKS